LIDVKRRREAGATIATIQSHGGMHALERPTPDLRAPTAGTVMVSSSTPTIAAAEDAKESPGLIPARRPAYVPRVADPRFILVRSGLGGGRHPPPTGRDRPRRD
jgi:hypothetical protein